MSRIVLVLAAGLLLCGAAKDEAPRPASPAPVIRVDPAGFDFGAVVARKTLRKEFRLRNAGDRELVLQLVRTSCGCTVGKLTRTTLTPGDSTSLLVTLDTRIGRGHIVKSVLVPSNDPKTPLLEIKIQATVGEPTAK